MLKSILKIIIGIVVIIGVWRGFVRYQESDAGNTLGQIADGIIGAISDLTFRLFTTWLPDFWNWLTTTVSSAG